MKNILQGLACLLLLTLCGCGSSSKHDPKLFHISVNADPDSLDPRKARDMSSANILNMLFEGLMRFDADGTLQPAAASSYTISPDGLTYTFTLRNNHWSNGQPVTADDFVYTWKTLLDPKFPAPNASQLFVIKNAEAAKRGTTSLDDVGLSAPDAHTLVVTLDKPAPHFLGLTAAHFLFPINSQIDRKDPKWAETNATEYISNGPFKLAEQQHHDHITVVKNPHYWDAPSIKLEGVRVITIDDNTALQLFRTGKLDWAGSPMAVIPPDAIASLKASEQLQYAPASAVHWLRLNTTKPPLDNPNMRRALALALNRQDIVEHVMQGGQKAATSIVPPSVDWQPAPQFKDHDVEEARALIEEVFGDETPPTLTLSYGASERNHKLAQAFQQQWADIGIQVNLEPTEAKVYYDKLKHGEYMIGNGGWFADYRDPINYLQVFRDRNNGTNNTGWEDSRYRELLDQSSAESDPTKRQELLQRAEALLMEQMPVIPVFYYTYNYLKNPRVKDVAVSELGIVNVRNASIE